MQFSVYSRQAIEAVARPMVRHLIISIRTPGDPRAVRLHPNECTRGILHLQFHDLEEIPADHIPILGTAGAPVPQHLVVDETTLFNEGHALQILDFVRSRAGDVGEIQVHCDAGWSRSPAVAAALSKALFRQDDSVWFRTKTPNKRVYRMILDVHARQQAAVKLPPEGALVLPAAPLQPPHRR
jgi:predicted protein tyrosine phosphatase